MDLDGEGALSRGFERNQLISGNIASYFTAIMLRVLKKLFVFC